MTHQRGSRLLGIRSVESFVDKNVSELTNKKQTPQHPPRESRRRLHTGEVEVKTTPPSAHGAIVPLLIYIGIFVTSVSPSVRAAEVKQYSGVFGGGSATFELQWQDDRQVVGGAHLSDGAIIQLSGSNYAEGRARLGILNQGQQIGMLDLAKQVSGKTISWSGVAVLNDGTRYDVRFSRSDQASTAAAAPSAMPLPAAPAARAHQRTLTFEEAKQRADQGDTFAQAVAALHYQLGWKTEKNPELAAEYAAASANAEEPLGQFRLGALMREGIGVPKDEQRGLSLQAASFNGLYNAQDPYSMTAAGILIFQGKVVGQNISQDERRRAAAALYRKAADFGFAPAQFNYAMCAEAGHGMAMDRAAAKGFLWQAVLREYPLAIQHLGFQNSSEVVKVHDLGGRMAQEPQRDALGALGVRAVAQRAPSKDAVACAVSSARDRLAVIASSIGLWELPSGRLLSDFPLPKGRVLFTFFRDKDLVVAVEDQSGEATLVFLDADTGVRSRGNIPLPADSNAVAYCPETDAVLCIAKEATSSYTLQYPNGSWQGTGGEPKYIKLLFIASQVVKEMPHPSFRHGSMMAQAMFSSDGNILLLNIHPEPPYYSVSEIVIISQSGEVLKQSSADDSDFLQNAAEALDLVPELISDGAKIFGAVIGDVPENETGDFDMNKLSFLRSFFEWNCPQPGVVLQLGKPVTLWLRDGTGNARQISISDNTLETYTCVAADTGRPGYLTWGVQGFSDSKNKNVPYTFCLNTLTKDLLDLPVGTTLLNARKLNAQEWVCSLGDREERGSNRSLQVRRALINAEGSISSSELVGVSNPYEITEVTIFNGDQAVWETRSIVENTSADNSAGSTFFGSLPIGVNAEGIVDYSAYPNLQKARYDDMKWFDGHLSTDGRLLALWNIRGQISGDDRSPSSARILTVAGAPVEWSTMSTANEAIVGVYPVKQAVVVITSEAVYMLDEQGKSVVSVWRATDADARRDLFEAPSEGAAVDDENGLIYVVGDTGSINVLKITENYEVNPLVRITHNTNGDPVLFEPSGAYLSLASNYAGIHFSDGQRTYPLEQFDLRLNRPDIVLERLGAPDEAVTIAKQLREKRLKRMGVTEEMLKPDFHVPELEIVGDVAATTDAGEINLSIKASDSIYPLERLKVYVNNVPVNGRDGESLRDQNSQSLDRTIPIKLAAGRNKIQVSVLNNAGAESLYANAEVNCTAERPKPTLYAVAMGVSEYSNPDWNLKYAAKDARDVLARLKAKEGDSYGEVKELLLADKEVTKESITKIKDFLSGATIDDTVLMFVAGHGLLDSKYDYYFGTADIDFNNPSDKGIAFEEFDDLLAELPSLKKSLLIDTCHAGELDEEEKTLLASAGGVSAALPTANGVAVRSIGTRGMNVKAVEGARGASEWYDRLQGLFVDLRRGSGSTILSSSAGAEYALESSEQQNGLFTYAVLEALDGKPGADTNKDGSIEMSELGEYVKKRVSELTNNKQTPNTRRVNLEGDFTLAKTR